MAMARSHEAAEPEPELEAAAKEDADELRTWLARKNLEMYLPGIVSAGISSLGALVQLSESGVGQLATAVGMSSAQARTLQGAVRRLSEWGG
jgi:hypothetical protein